MWCYCIAEQTIAHWNVMKYDWLPLAEDNYNRRWQASDAILIISVDIYSGIAHISMTIVNLLISAITAPLFCCMHSWKTHMTALCRWIIIANHTRSCITCARHMYFLFTSVGQSDASAYDVMSRVTTIAHVIILW